MFVREHDFIIVLINKQVYVSFVMNTLREDYNTAREKRARLIKAIRIVQLDEAMKLSIKSQVIQKQLDELEGTPVEETFEECMYYRMHENRSEDVGLSWVSSDDDDNLPTNPKSLAIPIHKTYLVRQNANNPDDSRR